MLIYVFVTNKFIIIIDFMSIIMIFIFNSTMIIISFIFNLIFSSLSFPSSLISRINPNDLQACDPMKFWLNYLLSSGPQFRILFWGDMTVFNSFDIFTRFTYVI